MRFPFLSRLFAAGALATAGLVLAPTAARAQTTLIANFNNTGFGYLYGSPNSWSNAGAITTGPSFLTLNATEFGGAGFFYGSPGISLNGRDGLLLTGRIGAGNQATQLQINVIRNSGGTATFFAPLTGFNDTDFRDVFIPFGAQSGTFGSVQQIQIQGTNFSASARALAFQFDNFAAVSVSVPEPGTASLLFGALTAAALVAVPRRRVRPDKP
jgi:hypothetical protein